MTTPTVTLIVPYYRNPAMLLRQAEEWARYPLGYRVIVVDDGSPSDPAHEVLPDSCTADVYRITTDVPWNRNGARNLGAHVSGTTWILHVDIDHVLTASQAVELKALELGDEKWYRFRRWRRGRADATRQKDALPDSETFGEIKPHIDSFLCPRKMYWRAGGYDEDFSGSLGGSSLFLQHMTEIAPPEVLQEVRLEVHTTDSVPDASDIHLSRDRSRYARIRAEKRAAGDPKPSDWLRFEWERMR